MDYFRQDYPMLSNIFLGNTPKPEPFHDYSMENNNIFLGHSYSFTHQSFEVPYNYAVGSSSNPNFPMLVTPPAVLNSLDSFGNGVNFLNPNLGGQYQPNVGPYVHDQYMFNEPHVVAPVNYVVAPEGNFGVGHGLNNELPKQAEERRKMKQVPAKKKLSHHGSASSSGVSKSRHIIKGQWSAQEDRLLIQLVKQYGLRKWAQIAKYFNGRVGKQCRERWHNHLRPDIKKDMWSEEEDRMLVAAHRVVGNKWSEIAKSLPGRTENGIKNHWNTTKRRELSKTKSSRADDSVSPSSYLQKYIKTVCAATPTLKERKKPQNLEKPQNLQKPQNLEKPPMEKPQNLENQPKKIHGYEEEGGSKIVEVGQSSKVAAVFEDPASEYEHSMDMEVKALLHCGVKKEMDLMDMFSSDGDAY